MRRNTTRLATLVITVAALCLLLPAASFASTVFVNGSFEVDPATFSSIDPTGWVTGGRIDGPPYVVNNDTFGNTPYGNQFLALGGIEDNAHSWVEQTVSGFTVGGTYDLTWAQSSEYTSADQLHVSFTAGSLTPDQTFTSVPYPGGTLFWYTWQNMSMKFVPDATSVTFHFQGVPNSGSYEVGVDNFQVTLVAAPTPEPGTLMLLGTGLVSICGGLRRRRKA